MTAFVTFIALARRSAQPLELFWAAILPGNIESCTACQWRGLQRAGLAPHSVALCGHCYFELSGLPQQLSERPQYCRALHLQLIAVVSSPALTQGKIDHAR